MAKISTKAFEDLMGLAGRFVEQQKGVWDNDAWIGFLSDMQKQGVKVTEEVQSNTGVLLESMKNFYDVSGVTRGIQGVMRETAENVVDFVVTNQGKWDQAAWGAFLKDLQKKVVTLTEETEALIGNILESTKELYSIPEFSKKSAPKSTK